MVAFLQHPFMQEPGKQSESITSEDFEGHWEKGSRGMHRRREEEMMGNESKSHRKDANMSSIGCRTGGESGRCGGLERGRSYKAEGLIGSQNGLVSLISEIFQNIENGDECRDIEKRERSVGPRFEALLEVEMLAMEGIERRMDDLRREARGVGKCLTIRLEDMETPHRKQNDLR
jgi:hypothetical protein